MTAGSPGNHRFLHALLKLMGESWNNDHKGNFDHFRYGETEKEIVDGKKGLLEMEGCLDELESFHRLLEDERSKDLLVRLLAFRILGHRKVRLPLSRPEYWKALDELAPLSDPAKPLEVRLMRSARNLYSTDLSPLGIPIALYTLPLIVLTLFVLRQYDYGKDDRSVIGAVPGDVVIDGGACWGDSALYFAHAVGERGKVFAFEFVPDNLKVAWENIRLNPHLEKTIRVVEHPLWDESGIRMSFLDNGPGSKVLAGPSPGFEGGVDTVSIDDFVARENLDRVDMIKLDVEGAEQRVLKGAQRTLRRFRPKLAVSIYHNMDDFAHVVHKIDGLDLGYRFYLDHFTIHREETVLYAQAHGGDST